VLPISEAVDAAGVVAGDQRGDVISVMACHFFRIDKIIEER
jgi:hypothetical protein